VMAHHASMQPLSTAVQGANFAQCDVEVAEVEVLQAHGGCSQLHSEDNRRILSEKLRNKGARRNERTSRL
jgi:hypothetical protein